MAIIKKTQHIPHRPGGHIFQAQTTGISSSNTPPAVRERARQVLWKARSLSLSLICHREKKPTTKTPRKTDVSLCLWKVSWRYIRTFQHSRLFSRRTCAPFRLRKHARPFDNRSGLFLVSRGVQSFQGAGSAFREEGQRIAARSKQGMDDESFTRRPISQSKI